MPPKQKEEEKQSLTRIAVVTADRCKPKKCSLECKKACPVNKQGKLCIEVDAKDKIAHYSEPLCIGCGLCVKRCPFGAVEIVNIPSNLEKETTHRYGPNSFKLHRLPLPRPGQVLGLVGPNGTGKSTALNILKGKLKPNLGKYKEEPSWEDILKHFRGSEHQAYFQHLLEDKVTALLKPQYVDQVPKTVKPGTTVREMLTRSLEPDRKEAFDKYVDLLDLRQVLDNEVAKLSGGELQRFTIGALCVRTANIYMFDEPSSYLDVKQRLHASLAIRSLLTDNNYIICVEHDLAVVDYLSDFVCVLYGRPGAYGVVTMPFGVREGINVFLDGFVPTENLRFREEGLTFRIHEEIEESKKVSRFKYPALSKTLGKFSLNVEPGEFTDSEIVVLLGENGCGKTTLIRLLAGHEKSDNGNEVPQLTISYKPQKIAPKFDGSVKDLLQTKIMAAYSHPQFVTDVVNPLKIYDLEDQNVQNLSGGELQRVAICLALGTPAQVYLLDEPSAYLDSDQRIIASRVIKRFILHAKKSAFIVEHDFIMATYLADRVIVYDGTPSVACTAKPPSPLLEGMNKFLRSLDITIRRDPTNYRPRINKHDSVKDREQKDEGNFFYMEQVANQAKSAKELAAAEAKEKAELAAAATKKHQDPNDEEEEEEAPKKKKKEKKQKGRKDLSDDE